MSTATICDGPDCRKTRPTGLRVLSERGWMTLTADDMEDRHFCSTACLSAAYSMQPAAAQQPRPGWSTKVAPDGSQVIAGNDGHLDIALGPGETITIRTDPARVEGVEGGVGRVVLRGRLIVGAASKDGSVELPPHLRLDRSYGVSWTEEV